MSKLGRLLGKGKKKNRRDYRRRKNEELEWMDFEEDEYEDEEDYYEDDEEIEEDEDYYEDEEESDEEDYYEEDYYGDDEEIEDEEDYYGDDEEIEDEEDYYGDDEEIEDEEDYYEDDEEIEDEEDYYEDDDEEYYEDDEIDDEEDYYEDDEDEIEDDEYYEDDEEPEGFFGKIGYKITHMSAVDHIVAFTGAAVLVLAVVTGTLYLGARISKQQIETFAEVGAGMEDMGVIGEAGLLAISDAQAAKAMVAEMDQQIEEPVDEKDESGKIGVTLNLTSIQKDLKIKFINKKTGKLIPNVQFSVEIEKPSGETYTKVDDDKDGIIYLTDIEPGKYKVKIISPASDGEYNISTEAIAITVKDTIEYKKVDVADEVKTESQVNAAVEDTKVNETVVESTNTDTVEWVESTKTIIDGTQKEENSYEKVDKSQIADPGKTASSGFRLLSGIEEPRTSGGDLSPTEEPTQEPDTEPTQEPSPTEAPTEEPTEEPTPEPTAAATPTTMPAPSVTPTVTPQVSPSVSPSASPSVSPSASPSVTPTATPTTTPTATPSATPTATPNGAKTDTKSILKSTSGETLYIKKDGKYVEAKYADCYTASEFFRKVTQTTGEYRYTGWQTIDGVTYFFDKNGNKVTGEQVIQGAKYNFNSDGSLNNSSGQLGIDVSKWNGNIDWNAVKNSGISYVIIRCGYRGSTTGALIEDPMFRSNIQGASKAGLKVGIYFFTQAVNEVEAVEEASMVLSLISGYNISYPVFLDVEATSGNNGRADGISVAARTAVCKAFCQTISNSGYKAGIYANKTWLNSFIDTPSLTGYKIWLAQYAAAPSYTRTKYDMWQYSSKGKVTGIAKEVDMNISYMGY